jgi:hypothetical protein
MPWGGLLGRTDLLSRDFVVGAVVPALVALAGLLELVGEDAFPSDYRRASSAVQVLSLVLAAVFVGMLLSALELRIWRVAEGYAMRHNALVSLSLRRQARKHARLRALQTAQGTPMRRRVHAAVALERFPDLEELMPTAFGNITRTREAEASRRWGLDAVTVWPHIEILMSDRAATSLSSARTTVNGFLNSVLLTLLGWLVCSAHYLLTGLEQRLLDWILLSVLAYVLGYGLYRAAVDSADALGRTQSAVIDLCRLDVYQQVGARRPCDPDDEVALARAVTDAIRTGAPLSADFRAQPPDRSDAG